MTNQARYSSGQRRLHWLMVVLIAAIYLFVEQRGIFPRGSGGRAAMMQSHFWFGLSVLLLAGWRLLLRLRGETPPITPPLPRWQELPAKALHLAFYAFFFVMPLLGLATAWTDGKSLLIPFTQVAIPPLLGTDKAWAHWLEDLHGWIGNAFYWVIGLHVLATAYHHWVRRDDTLRRMI